MVKQMDLELSNILIKITIKVNLRMIKRMDLVSIFTMLRVRNIKDFGKMICNMVKA